MVVYTVMGKPAECEDISIPLFVRRYLAVMAAEKLAMHLLMAQHLQELMGDAELYRMGAHQGFPCHMAPTIGARQSDLG